MSAPTKDDSGPAFPVGFPGGIIPGMSRRDWFAGMALQGLLASEKSIKHKGITVEWNEHNAAVAAYAVADAMIAQSKLL